MHFSIATNISQGGSRHVPVPLQIRRSPLATAETTSQLEFFSKFDRMNSTTLTEVYEDNGSHRICLARMPCVASTGPESPTRISLVKFEKFLVSQLRSEPPSMPP